MHIQQFKLPHLCASLCTSHNISSFITLHSPSPSIYFILMGGIKSAYYKCHQLSVAKVKIELDVVQFQSPPMSSVAGTTHETSNSTSDELTPSVISTSILSNSSTTTTLASSSMSGVDVTILGPLLLQV